MSELDDFLTPTLARQLEAEKALINGDPGPRLAMWSTQDPVTVFGAMRSDIGSEEVRQVFRWLATRFSNLTDYRFELVAAGASGDLAYALGYEHASSMDGGPVQPITLRVTHVYRREDGEWKIVHRHADAPPDRSAPTRRGVDGVSVTAGGQGRAGAISGPHPSRASRTTAVTSGRPTFQLSSSLRSATQVLGPPRFSLARRSQARPAARPRAGFRAPTLTVLGLADSGASSGPPSEHDRRPRIDRCLGLPCSKLR